ncbi:MAG TPA: hypothetical protein VN408_20480 [Actinoplanes sp.]|nr:hypothetical protein [Actinoplanes sp.]
MPATRIVAVLIVSGIVAVGGFLIHFHPGDSAVTCQGQTMPRGGTCVVATSTVQEARSWQQQADAQRSTRAGQGLLAGIAGSVVLLGAAGYLLLGAGANRD